MNTNGWLFCLSRSSLRPVFSYITFYCLHCRPYTFCFIHFEMFQTTVTSPVHYSSHTFSPTGQILRPSSDCFVNLENNLSLHKSFTRPTSELTTWGRVLLKKITDPQFPSCYGTQRFITTFTRARLLSLFRAGSIQSMPPHSTSWMSILMLSWFFQVVSFPQVSPPKPCIHLSPIRATCSAHLILLYLITGIIFGDECRWSAY